MSKIDYTPAKPITSALQEKIQAVMEGKTPEGFSPIIECPYCHKRGFDHEGELCCGEVHTRTVHVSDTNPEDVRDADTHKKVNESLDENESISEEYSDKNPKIDLHHKETGKYIASTNWSPTVKHAVSAYEDKNPSMKGMIKGFKATK